MRTKDTHANDILLSNSFVANTTARGRTCIAVLMSNSNSPPPAMPPSPHVNQHKSRLKTLLLLSAALKPVTCVGEARSERDGAMMNENPSAVNGLAASLVAPARAYKSKWVVTSWQKVIVSGYGNLTDSQSIIQSRRRAGDPTCIHQLQSPNVSLLHAIQTNRHSLQRISLFPANSPNPNPVISTTSNPT
jgi:hypothetical protein